MRIVLFDIDGTLLLTGGAGLEALRRVFREDYGVDEAAEGIEFHGRTDPMILRSIAAKWLGRPLEHAELARLRERYVAHLEATLGSAERFRVLPGAREALEALRARRDTLLGLATGNFEEAARAKLRRAGLWEYFGFGGYGSDSEDRVELTRRALERGRRAADGEVQALLVGDTVHDVRCALALGLDCLGVATGTASEGALREAGARWTAPGLESEAARRALGIEGARQGGPGGPIDPPRRGC